MRSVLKQFGGFSQQVPLLLTSPIAPNKKIGTYMPLSEKFYSIHIKDEIKKCRQV